MKVARLFVTHVWSDEIEQEFRKLAACNNADCWLLLDSKLSLPDGVLSRYPLHHIFSPQSLAALPYTKMSTTGLIGNGHFPILEFFLLRPDYDFYWFIEYDVRYTGDWSAFFGRFDSTEHDFTTAHIRRFTEEPFWWWWPSLGHPTIRLSRREWLRSFNVIYRISNRALEFLDCVLQSGWRGHHEALLATVLHHNNFKLLDFGGHGSFVEAGSKNLVYTSSGSRTGFMSPLGTLRDRPPRPIVGSEENMLYHPIKPVIAGRVLPL
jgi:Protein of unknown function (DUF3405)